jgi:predicted PurR-regulated permease PerM
MQRIGELRASAGNIGSAPPPAQGAAAPAAAPAPAPAPQESAPAMLLDATRGVVLSCVTVIILTLFLLSGGPPMLARMTSAFASDMKSGHILDVIEKVRSEVGRFYVTTAFAMYLCGMPTPFLWGTMAAILTFIPYAGATVSLIVMTVVAIISFNGLGHALAVAGCYLAIATVEGQFIQPLLVGRRLQLNPMLVFLALWFGGLFWGIAGIILATPALAALKVVATNSTGGQQLLEFLSPHKDEQRGEIRGVEPETPLAVALRQRGPLPPPV